MPKTIGIGITGGIAAYKITDLVSKLKKNDYEVIVLMTEGAARFITPLTLKTISGREVLTDLWQDSPEWKVQHIGMAEEIDLLVVAPATANIIGKMANGIADDLLSTVYLANTAPVIIVPAMNSNMYQKPVVQENLNRLKSHGCTIIAPECGELACGASGPGRLPDIEVIYQAIVDKMHPKQDLKGKKLMVNAGTTCEDIDPVRFIANRGTGKMGFAIAEAARNRGAEVVLIAGKSSLEAPEGVEFHTVWGAEEMCARMLEIQTDCDIIIGAAAVGDFQIAAIAQQKLKKKDNETQQLILELVGTPDILKELGKKKRTGQIMVGFAAETENVLENARKKLKSKNLDFIVANDVTMEGAGFATDTNIVTFIDKNGGIAALPQMTKYHVAEAILDRIVDLIKK
ncbi:MAG: bifunctional phosphopantothenoylcysteine decarboxylase/phosphopantothenate--cysteine ligase CoaBC [Syntrophomonadaceae bacterium]|nr:bifunctional phosphopantothenoylcysteine decarboxylase/phosphopantothenate--cysteine ligase CoaBC [Syntrophomonadaceae bacterium]